MSGIPDDWVAVFRLPVSVQQLARIVNVFPDTVILSPSPELEAGGKLLVLCPATPARTAEDPGGR
jgi:hypothetical protein